MTRRELIAADLARKSGVTLTDYPYRSSAPYVRTQLDSLRGLEDEGLRQQAWDLYWLMRAAEVEHNYRLGDDQAELDRRFP